MRTDGAGNIREWDAYIQSCGININILWLPMGTYRPEAISHRIRTITCTLRAQVTVINKGSSTGGKFEPPVLLLLWIYIYVSNSWPYQLQIIIHFKFSRVRDLLHFKQLYALLFQPNFD